MNIRTKKHRVLQPKSNSPGVFILYDLMPVS